MSRQFIHFKYEKCVDIDLLYLIHFYTKLNIVNIYIYREREKERESNSIRKKKEIVYKHQLFKLCK